MVRKKTAKKPQARKTKPAKKKTLRPKVKARPRARAKAVKPKAHRPIAKRLARKAVKKVVKKAKAAKKKPALKQARPSKAKPPARVGKLRAPNGPNPAAVAPPPAPKAKHLPDIERPTGMYGGVQLTNNPKPFPKKSPYAKEELSTLRRTLLEERDQLRRELVTMEGMTMGTAEAELESPGFPTHIAEYASHMQATETILGVRSLEEERLEQVEEALDRLERKANYGLCLGCGSKIGIERLIAKPYAHLCLDCRRIYERNRGIAT
jgi:RNA polymerase-binding transcription factor DksA